MKRNACLRSVVLFGLSFIFLSSPVARPSGAGASTSSRQRLVKAYGHLPLSFEANRGQADPQVRFVAHGPGYTLFLREREAVLRLRKPSHTPDNSRRAVTLRPQEWMLGRERQTKNWTDPRTDSWS